MLEISERKKKSKSKGTYNRYSHFYEFYKPYLKVETIIKASVYSMNIDIYLTQL